jgi:hypothetical protein
MSHLRDGASWIWPGGALWQRSFAGRGVGASETEGQGPAEAPARDARTRSKRFSVSKPEKELRGARWE